MELEDIEDLPHEFKGGSLEFNSDESKNSLLESVSTSSLQNCSNVNLVQNNNNSNKNRWNESLISIPQRIAGTLWNKKETNPEEGSTNAVSLKPSADILTVGNPNNFFTFRKSIIDEAVKECAEQFLDPETDGPLVGSFLLTEISLWDTDKERLLLITRNSLVNIKYDFIALRRLEYKKVSLNCVDTIITGNLVYPSGSIVPHLHGFADGLSSVVNNCLFDAWSKNRSEGLPNYFHPSRNRNMRGIRVMWNNGKPLNFGTKWNPLCNDVPFSTFSSHPLFFHKDCTNNEQKKIYSIEDFIETICANVGNCLTSQNNQCIIHHKDILLDNYLGIGSLIHNRNALGFFKVRGRFSF